MLETLADLIAPISLDEFFEDIHRQKPLHIKGAANKFKDVLGWSSLSEMLSQAGIWTAKNLELVNDGKKVSPEEYCIPGQDRDHRPNHLVDIAKVKTFLQKGASLVLNDAGTLSGGISNITRILGESLYAGIQANIYCSWKAYQGFSSHFDSHDVWALHVEGTKTWNLYERHFENPIAHPKFRTLGPDFHKTNRGALTETVTMEPGDLLYIPRGWYHDALATSEASLHITYGSTPLIGLDALSQVYDLAIDDPAFRADLPAPGNLEGQQESELKTQLETLAQKLGNILTSESFLRRVLTAQQQHRPLLGSITLPDDGIANYSIKNKDIKVFTEGGKWFLGNNKQSLPIPAGMEPPTRWIVEQNQFSEPDLSEAFPALSEAARRKLIADLCAMRVLITA